MAAIVLRLGPTHLRVAVAIFRISMRSCDRGHPLVEERLCPSSRIIVVAIFDTRSPLVAQVQSLIGLRGALWVVEVAQARLGNFKSSAHARGLVGSGWSARLASCGI